MTDKTRTNTKTPKNTPVFVESTLALIANVLSKDGLEIAQTLQRSDVAHHSHHDQRRSLDNSDCLHLLSLCYLWEREKRYLTTI